MESIKTLKGNGRITQSDGDKTYYSFSSSKTPGEFDGLWSHGFRLFGNVYSSGNLTDNEINPLGFRHWNIMGRLLKRNKGLILEFNNDICFECKAEVVTNDSFLLLKYNNPEREGFEVESLFLKISLLENESMTQNQITVEHNGENLLLKITTKGSGDLFLQYSPDIPKEFNPFDPDFLDKDGDLCTRSIERLGVKSNCTDFDKALYFAQLASDSFIMNKNNKLGIWAGFPWFDNSWGRDTFIALSGICLAQGLYKEAREIIRNFFLLQNRDENSDDFGKIPNVVFSKENTKYNTGDGTPLLIRAVYEYYLCTNDIDLVVELWDYLTLCIEEGFINSRNSKGLVVNNDADDWMDARRMGQESYSPRGENQVEIQALWYTCLWGVSNLGSEIAPLSKNSDKILCFVNTYQKLAKDFGDIIRSRYIKIDPPYILDTIRKDGDVRVRPNSLLAVFYSDLPGIPQLFPLGVIEDNFKYLSRNCVFTHGVASLSVYDKNFHPRHMSDMHHKDAAYHNGAIWLWLSGAFVHTGAKLGLKDSVFLHTKELVNLLLNGENLGTLPELLEPVLLNNIHKFSGTFSQAWSVSEFVRSFYKDYLGITLDVPNNKIYISPNLPKEFKEIDVRIPFGNNVTIDLKYLRGHGENWYVKLSEESATTGVELKVINGYSEKKVIEPMGDLYVKTLKFDEIQFFNSEKIKNFLDQKMS